MQLLVQSRVLSAVVRDRLKVEEDSINFDTFLDSWFPVRNGQQGQEISTWPHLDRMGLATAEWLKGG